MPRFRFHSRRGGHLDEDLEGQELPDLSAAGREAFNAAREILADAVKFGHTAPDAIVIADANGHQLKTVPLKDTLPENICDSTSSGTSPSAVDEAR